jgi:ribosomal protein S18 acetylase RimI-like enzyme
MTSRNRSGSTTENNIRIRDAKLSDAPELAVLMCELGYETKPTEMEARLKLILSNPAYKTFVAVMDGCVCGMIGTLAYPSYEHDDPSGRILALVTLAAARRRGIGRALIAAAEKDFEQKGVTRVALERTADPRRCPQILRVARLRAKRVAICEATSGEQIIGTRCGHVGAFLRSQ